MRQPIATTRYPDSDNQHKHILVLATTNQGKIHELRDLLGNRYDVRGLDACNVTPAEETGETFEANAILKAEAVAQQTGLPALADDSGLEVDALGGAPGVYSARFSGAGATDASNRALLLDELRTIEPGQRACRFVCVVAFARPGQCTLTVRGTCGGSVGLQERGTNGFGYDSLFVLPDGRTMAQLEPAEKSRISHRGQAMTRMLPILHRELTDEGA